MDPILTSEVFDHFDKTYLLDRIAGHMSGPIIRITETVNNGTRRGQHVVEIDAVVLKRIQELANATVQYDGNGKPSRVVKPFTFTPADMNKIVANYLRGVPYFDLALQFGCKDADIISVLKSRDIPVINEEVGKRKWRGRSSRKT
ncbi:MAG TPA: hypothetical protein PK149_14635 [Flavobacteriales bacterium]|nr:hypothetical protein [Flavobacteriales bacterium]